MKTFVLALLTLAFSSAAVSAATTYTFTLNTPRGPIGFTYIATEPLPQSSLHLNMWNFASCNTTGAPGWTCVSAYLQQTNMNGLPIVQVTLEIGDMVSWGDAFTSDELTDTFAGASLGQPGTYTGFLSPTTFTITALSGPTSAEVPATTP